MHYILLAATLVAAHASDWVIHIDGQEGLQPKFIFEDGQVSGICPDIMHAVEHEDPSIHFVISTRPLSTPLLKQALDVGRRDAACGLVDDESRRAVAMRVPTPLYAVHERVAVRADDTVDVKDIDELAQLHTTVLTNKGASYVDYLRSRGIDVDDTSDDTYTGLRRVLAGRARFFYMNDVTLMYAIHHAQMDKQIRLLPAVLGQHNLYFWLSHKLPANLVDRLDIVLAKLAARGELQKIYQRYQLN